MLDIVDVITKLPGNVVPTSGENEPEAESENTATPKKHPLGVKYALLSNSGSVLVYSRTHRPFALYLLGNAPCSFR